MTTQAEKDKKKLLINIKGLYDKYETSGDFNSINEKYRSTVFKGIYQGKEKFSGKYGETSKYLFETEDGNKWSLLSSSNTLDKITDEIPSYVTCEVYKNKKSQWEIMPY